MRQTFEDFPLVLSAAELAEALNISQSGAYQLLHQESFPGFRIGKRLMVTRDNLVKWINESSTRRDTIDF